MWSRRGRRSHAEQALRPWEERALERAKQGDFTPYVELSYSYLVLDSPRSDLLLRAFKGLMRDKEVSRSFHAYCRHHQLGGLTGYERVKAGNEAIG